VLMRYLNQDFGTEARSWVSAEAVSVSSLPQAQNENTDWEDGAGRGGDGPRQTGGAELWLTLSFPSGATRILSKLRRKWWLIDSERWGWKECRRQRGRTWGWCASGIIHDSNSQDCL
jgi:hypothetical protein